MKNDKISHKVLYSVLGTSVIFLIIVILIVILFYKAPKTVENVNLHAGDVSLTYADISNEFSIINAVPTSNALGMKFDSADQYFDFTVTTNFQDADSIIYEISLVKDKKSNILDKDIVVYLEKQENGSYVSCMNPTSFKGINKKSEAGSKSGSMIIAKVTKDDDSMSADNYRLRMWMSEKAVATTGTNYNYSVKVNVNAMAK